MCLSTFSLLHIDTHILQQTLHLGEYRKSRHLSEAIFIRVFVTCFLCCHNTIYEYIFSKLTQRTLCLKLSRKDEIFFCNRERREWDKATKGTKERNKRVKLYKKLIFLFSATGVYITEVTDKLQRWFCGSCNPEWIMYPCKRGVSPCWYAYYDTQPKNNIPNSVSVTSFKLHFNLSKWSLQNLKF
jgi:hypothetical protein